MYPTVIASLTFSTVIYSLYRMLVMRREQQSRIQLGLALTSHIKKIIDSSQKHRGTSNAINQGNEQLKPQLLALQNEIDRLIHAAESQPLRRFPQWESFIEHWPRLKKHAIEGDLKSYNLVRQHNLMIESQLSLLDDVMRYYDLHKMMLDRTTRVSEICLDTLRVAETIGQTRAIGSGICAHGSCEGADKIIINFLRISVQSSTEDLIKELQSIDNATLKTGLGSTSSSIKSSVSNLIKMIESDLLVDGKLGVDTNSYFSTSTKAIDEVMKVFGIITQYAVKHHVRMV